MQRIDGVNVVGDAASVADVAGSGERRLDGEARAVLGLGYLVASGGHEIALGPRLLKLHTPIADVRDMGNGRALQPWVWRACASTSRRARVLKLLFAYCGLMCALLLVMVNDGDRSITLGTSNLHVCVAGPGPGACPVPSP